MSGVLTLPTPTSTRAFFVHPADAELPRTLDSDDARIVMMIHAGDYRGAVEQTARAFGPRLYRFFARWRSHDADDLVQEVLVKMYETIARGRFKAHVNLAPWLFKVAANARRDAYRKSRRQADLLVQHHGTVERDLHGGSTHDTWCSLSRGEQRMWLGDAIRGLPEEDQELLALRYDACLPWTEVARVLGMRVSTAKMRFTQIRTVLNERWQR
ncbi:MAG: RNA polymerase sigma factor (sigma-70 family) [Myxococcota bacterium]|jgi:RNA polymerase sigma factor (sigma-70 family)